MRRLRFLILFTEKCSMCLKKWQIFMQFNEVTKASVTALINLNWDIFGASA